jgi:hypothetical protein
MVEFLKENGFPIDLYIETESYEEDDPKEGHWKGFKSKVYLDREKTKLLKEFYHSQWRDRNLFADGVFTILKHYHENKKSEISGS